MINGNMQALGLNGSVGSVLTPAGTKMIVKAFCPKTPLYETLNNYKKNSNMRVVVTRGDKMKFV